MLAEISILLVKLKLSAAQLHTQHLLVSSVLCDLGVAATSSDEVLSSNWLMEALRQANGLESNMPRNDKKAKEPTMLSDSKLQSIILTSRISEAETFYRDVLGLSLRTRSEGALVFDVGGGDLRVSPVPSTTSSEHTVLGFAVNDVDGVIAFLSARGVTFERFEGFTHEDNGTLLTPDGARVAWFRDPDGNILSVVQFPSSDY